MNHTEFKKQILDAWAFMRQNNNSIPDEVLDFMKDASLKELRRMNIYFPKENKPDSAVDEANNILNKIQ